MIQNKKIEKMLQKYRRKIYTDGFFSWHKLDFQISDVVLITNLNEPYAVHHLFHGDYIEKSLLEIKI